MIKAYSNSRNFFLNSLGRSYKLNAKLGEADKAEFEIQ